MKISHNAKFVNELSSDEYQIWEITNENGLIQERTEYFPKIGYMKTYHYDTDGKLIDIVDSSGSFTRVCRNNNITTIQIKTPFLYMEKVYSNDILMKEYIKTAAGEKENINNVHCDQNAADHINDRTAYPGGTIVKHNQPDSTSSPSEDISCVSINEDPYIVQMPDQDLLVGNNELQKANREKQKLSIQTVKNFVDKKLKKQPQGDDDLVFVFENEGIKKSIEYTPNGTILKIKTLYKASNIISLQDFSENINHTILPDGTVNVIETDASGRPSTVRTIKPDGTFITENTNGKVIDYFDKDGNFTEFSYDNLGNIITKHLMDNAGNETWINIDNSSSYLTMMDDGKYSIQSFDRYGRLIYYRSPDTIEYKYVHSDTEMIIKGYANSGDKIIIKYNEDSQLIFYDDNNYTYQLDRQGKQMLEVFLDKKTMTEKKISKNYTPILLGSNLYDIHNLLQRRFINIDDMFK